MAYLSTDRRVMWRLSNLLTIIESCMTLSSIASNISDKSKLYNRDQTTEQFCTGETFRPRCVGGRNDVIVILAARYGRMNFGRCVPEEEEPEFQAIKNNPRFIGCSTDVKHILDYQCSGLTECDLRILNQNFEGVKSCIAGLHMYLEASYACIQVAAESRHCTVPLTTEPQHIVGGGRSRQVQTDPVGCGTESQPWSVEALSGQRIAVSLIDFAQAERTAESSSNGRPGCHTFYGLIVDKSSRTNTTICSSLRQVLRGSQHFDEDHSILTNVYTSRTNQLLVFLKHEAVDKSILRVEAVGCSDLAPPSDSAWLKRVDDQITIGCYLSRQSWKLNCINGVWTGTVGVCNNIYNDEGLDSRAFDESANAELVFNEHPPTTELAALVAVASAGVAVCCLVICIGVFCLRRQQRLTEKDSSKRFSSAVGEMCQTDNRMNAGLLVHTTS